jgi:hypothetical protein
MTRPERFLKLIIRILGTGSATVAFFVAVPYAWMNDIHQWLGLGTLPDTPVVGYLARSTSAFYALFGGLLWVLSFDLRRHLVVLRYLGVAIVLFGATLLVVDWVEGLPLFWRLWEGPIDVAYGIAILWLSRRIRHPGGENADGSEGRQRTEGSGSR